MMAQWDYVITGPTGRRSQPPHPNTLASSARPCTLSHPSTLPDSPAFAVLSPRAPRSPAAASRPRTPQAALMTATRSAWRGKTVPLPPGRKGDAPLRTPEITSSLTISSPRLCMISIGSSNAPFQKRPYPPVPQRPNSRPQERVMWQRPTRRISCLREDKSYLETPLLFHSETLVLGGGGRAWRGGGE